MATDSYGQGWQERLTLACTYHADTAAEEDDYFWRKPRRHRWMNCAFS
ncbi:hypothetical protein [Aquisalimonas sp.]|nr:hypothetical protein [Aquisalimonas sp.]